MPGSAGVRGPRRRVEEGTAAAVARCCASCVTVRGERFPHIVAGYGPSSACRFRFSSRWQKRPGGYSTSSREGQRWLSLITFRTRSGAGMGEVKSPKEGLTRTRCQKWASSVHMEKDAMSQRGHRRSNAKSEAWHGESRRRSRGSAPRHIGSYQKGIAVRRLMCCLLYRPPQQRRVDGGAVATSVSGALPEGAFGCGKGMIVVICHEERRYLPW